MLLSELAEKELIEMENGVRFGFLADSECLFDPKTGKIHGFELAAPFRLSFSKKKTESSVFIPWEEILLIGEDRILFQKTVPTSKQYKQ
ncbi:YlmC/YmxH family sporulation protein [Lysinibacillus sp. 54212]|uniref:YlmC/YmxH family sporulation protein n=1 Tax=Lysinibacillus sp. 54212 TaxID=3119829 RepID=UPI002FCB92D0